MPDPAPATKMRASVIFDVAGDVPHKDLTSATDAGLAAARAALAPDGSADAAGSLGSVKDATRTARIELTLRASGPSGAMQAEKAFADAFLAYLERKGHAAQRR